MSTYEDIKDKLLKDKVLFEDKDFPPNDVSLYGEYPKTSERAFGWKRATEIDKVNPSFILEGASRHDLDQGKLGNCWFIAAAATLTTCPQKQFERVVPPHQQFYGDYAGIFRFNFWWYGSWREVLIDDYLPCDDHGLVFCKNREHPNEYWVALLEKAYAKLNGSYEALNGGKLQDALIDMTGGITEVIHLRDKASIPADLHDIIVAAHRMNSVSGASIWKPRDSKNLREIRKPNGLYMGHAYSITGLAQVEYDNVIHKLLRVRNPWGKGEWNGAWSDLSKEMKNISAEQKKRLEFTKKHDGEFWISYSDFVANFDELQMCHLQPDSMTRELAIDAKKDEWQTSVYHDCWIRGLTAGGCGNAPYQSLYWNNPQYHVKLEQPDSHDGKCTLVVSLMQKYWSKKHHVAIGFDLYKLKSDETEPLDDQRVSKSALILCQRPDVYQYYRDMCRRFRVPPGVYIIVCSTFVPHREAQFLLRVYSEKPAASGLANIQSASDNEFLNKAVTRDRDLVRDVFNKLSGIDKQVNAQELHVILQQLFVKDIGLESNFSLEMCRSLHVMMDLDKSGLLGLDEVRDMWKNVKIYYNIFTKYKQSEKVETFQLGKMFRNLGLPINMAVLKTLVRRYADRDNRISLEDFIMAVCKMTTLFFMFSDVRSKKACSQSSEIPISLNEWLAHGLFC